MAECQLPKLNVEGSTPFRRSSFFIRVGLPPQNQGDMKHGEARGRGRAGTPVGRLLFWGPRLLAIAAVLFCACGCRTTPEPIDEPVVLPLPPSPTRVDTPRYTIPVSYTHLTLPTN